MEVYILSQSTKCFSIGDQAFIGPEPGSECEVGRELEREGPRGWALLERTGEGRNMVVITYLGKTVRCGGCAKGNSEPLLSRRLGIGRQYCSSCVYACRHRSSLYDRLADLESHQCGLRSQTCALTRDKKMF